MKNSIAAPEFSCPSTGSSVPDLDEGSLALFPGAVPSDSDSSEMIAGEIEEKTDRVYKNIEAILKVTGFSLQECGTGSQSVDLLECVRMVAVWAPHFPRDDPGPWTRSVAAPAQEARVELADLPPPMTT